jgi:hypothetical protein
MFRENPKMKYYYDELFNDADYTAHRSHSHPRDKMMEQNITYSIMSALATYSVFYYSHVELDDYKDLVIVQRERVIKIVNQFLKSKIFKENVVKGLNDFAGLNLIRFFKEFFNVVPSNPRADAH